MSIILFYTPILNGDELQLLGMARRNGDIDRNSEKPMTFGLTPQPKGQDIDIVVVTENNYKIEDAIN
jgi:hypothetical protein